MPIFLLPWLLGGGALIGAGVTYEFSQTAKNVLNTALIAGAAYLILTGKWKAVLK
jgi:hypothetical protein